MQIIYWRGSVYEEDKNRKSFLVGKQTENAESNYNKCLWSWIGADLRWETFIKSNIRKVNKY